jgi:hypothetical protein
MIDPLSKAVGSLTNLDLETLISGQYPETSRLELKEALPSKDGLDPWTRGDARIGDRARDVLLSELVGFANADGGLLLVGIQESDDDPRRAVAVKPIPNVAALADRFSQQIRDCIDPPLNGFDASGIVTSDEGDGVLAVQVTASPRAPHRVTTTKECYRRVGTRTERMDMRAIQDLSLVRFASAGALEQRFESQATRASESEERFTKKLSRYNLESIRVSCIPGSLDLGLSSTYQNTATSPLYTQHIVLIDGREVRLDLPAMGYSERPILRGTRFLSEDSEFRFTRDVMRSGLVEYHLMHAPPSDGPQQDEQRVYPEWVLALLLNTLLTVDRVRNAARSPEVEYLIEISVRFNGVLQFAPLSAGWTQRTLGVAETNPLVFPRLSYGSQSHGQILGIVLEDIYHASGAASAHTSLKVAPAR